jgi:hypothetical protein
MRHNYRPALDAGRTVSFYTLRHLPGARERGRSACRTLRP